MNLRSFDLNLLLAFEAVLTEASVTRAASRLGMSQPALSEALGRLRQIFGDELFVRTPQGMRPTCKAVELAEPIAGAMAILRRALDAEAPFDPLLSRRLFRIGCGDYAEAILLPALSAKLRTAAPQIDIRMVLTTPRLAPDLIDRGEIDLAIDVFPDDLPQRFERVGLLEEHALCLTRKARRGAIDLKAYAALAHAARSPTGETGGVVERALKKKGLQRRVAVTVSHVLALHAILVSSDLIATQPSRVARLLAGMGGLKLFDPPLAIERWKVELVLGRSADAAVQWLKRAFMEIGAGL